MAFKNVDVEVADTFSCREWAMHDNPYPKEQIIENSTRADLRWELRCLAKRKCAGWGFVMPSSWSVSVVLEYTKPRLARTSVLDERRNPLVSWLIGGGICHWMLGLSEVAVGLLISVSIPGWSAKDTRCSLQLDCAVLSPTPSQSWLVVDRIWGSPEKSPFSVSESRIYCQVPTCFSVYIWIVAEERTRSAQCGGTVPVRRYGTVVKSSSKTTWNWGETWPVLGLKISATLEACKGNQPTKIPIRAGGSHFGTTPCPDWSQWSNT